MQAGNIRLAADIGGTFTDVAAFDQASGRLALGKSLSTPASLVDGISDGVAKAGTRFADAAIFLHGSTIAINTMLERTGARTALITTRGFRDVYEIGRINRPDAYNLYFTKHEPLVRRSLRRLPLAAPRLPSTQTRMPWSTQPGFRSIWLIPTCACWPSAASVKIMTPAT